MPAQQFFRFSSSTCGGATYAFLPLLLSVLSVINKSVKYLHTFCTFDWLMFGISLLTIFQFVSLVVLPIHFYFNIVLKLMSGST